MNEFEENEGEELELGQDEVFKLFKLFFRNFFRNFFFLNHLLLNTFLG
jgi:hypothetical protein